MQIHDTGIGIYERQQSQLFQAFHQADDSISRSHDGTRLELVITQKLVKDMGVISASTANLAVVRPSGSISNST